MSKGGGGSGGGTQEVVQTTSNLPEYARPYFEEMLGRTMYETTRPYEAYPARRLAEFDPYETQAMQGLATMEAPGQVGTATGIVESVAGPGGPTFEAGTIADPATLQGYMSPYQQLVTDIEKREAARMSDIRGADISQQAAQAGGLGGYREAIMQAERERNLGQQMQDIQARGSQAAYEQAQQAFEADRAARLREAQFGAERGQQRLDAARILGALGGQEQAMDIERLLNMQTAGQIQRELGQRGLDIGYQDFLRQQAFPREQLAYFSNILRGLPITPGQTTATFGQAPGFAQQALGAGIGGVGLYRALGG